MTARMYAQIQRRHGSRLALAVSLFSVFALFFILTTLKERALWLCIWSTDSWRWCLRLLPDQGSMENFEAGKTYCHPHSFGALGIPSPRRWGRMRLRVLALYLVGAAFSSSPDVFGVALMLGECKTKIIRIKKNLTAVGETG